MRGACSASGAFSRGFGVLLRLSSLISARACLLAGRPLGSSLGGVECLRRRHGALGLLLLASRVAGVMQWSLSKVTTSVALVGNSSSSGGHTVGCYGGMSHQRSVVRLTVWVYSFLSKRLKES